MRHIATDVARSVVCLSVSVCCDHGWAQQKRRNRSRCRGPKEACIRWGLRFVRGKGRFCWLSGPSKNIGILCCYTRSKRIIQSWVTAQLSIWPFVKVLWPPVKQSDCYTRQANNVLFNNGLVVSYNSASPPFWVGEWIEATAVVVSVRGLASLRKTKCALTV